MKILYAVQGTGNGHLSRAQAMIPELQKFGKLDLVVTGALHSKMPLHYPIKYNFKGIGYTFGNNGGFNFSQTCKNLNVPQAFTDAHSIPVQNYDLVISDFEPVTAWACDMKKVPCVHLSHQAALLQKNVPRPYLDLLTLWFIDWFIPCTQRYGFHYKAYHSNIFTPIIRPEIRDLKPTTQQHYSVYLPFYSVEKLLNYFSEFNVTWHIFSNRIKSKEWHGNVLLHPFDSEAFAQSVATCAGTVCGAGFMASSEMLYLGKKMLVMPMKKQFEQKCNAYALKQFDVPSISALVPKHKPLISNWLQDKKIERIDFPIIVPTVVQQIVENRIK